MMMSNHHGGGGGCGAAGPFRLPAQQRWRWLCLPPLEGQVTVRPLPPDNGSGVAANGEGAYAAAANAAAARVLALVREGGGLVGEWVEPEEGGGGSSSDEDNGSSSSSSSSSSSGEDQDQDDDDDDDERQAAEHLPRLVLMPQTGADGAAASSPPLMRLETVRWSEACELTYALALKSLVALAPLEIVRGKLARVREEEQGGEAAGSMEPAPSCGPRVIQLTVRLRVRLCVNEARPRLCPEHRKGELPKLLRLANLVLLTTAEDLPLPDRLLLRRPRRRLATLFEEASAAGPSVQASPRPAQEEGPLASSSSSSSSPLTALLDELLGLIFSYFGAADLRAVGQTCRALQAATKSIVPGLKTRLFPHQLRSLNWMLARETGGAHGDAAAGGGGGGRSVPHPAWEELRGCCQEKDGSEASSPCSVWVSMLDGRLAFTADGVPRVPDARGGLLADQMGLGKTVSALALILKTRGLLPSPPPPPPAPGSGEAAARFDLRSPQTRRRQVDPRSLIPSSATMVVSPGPLLQHWKEQIELHCMPWALGLGTHVLIDDADERGRLPPLPPAEQLATYDVVVVSKERLRQEWKTGRPACALEERRPRRYSTMGFMELRAEAGGLSPLLQVRWLRVVVDEGHSLGALSITNEILMAKSLEAERRWAMTGTPHRHDAADLASLRELLSFLREAPYGVWDDGSCWPRLISGGRGSALLPPALAERRLLALLRRVMIRHTKAATDIPRPLYVRTRLRMSRLEASTYNTLVSLVQANLLTTGLEGGSHPPGAAHPDSILNPINKASSNSLLHNLRLACCGGGQQVISLDAATVAETLNLARAFGCSGGGGGGGGGSTGGGNSADGGAEERLAKVAGYLSRLRNNTVTPCDSCGVPLLILLITPCLHLLCCRCMRGRNNVCGRCMGPFDVDEFQLLQPGLSVHWREDDALLVLPPPHVPNPPAASPGAAASSSSAAAVAGSPVAAVAPEQPQERGEAQKEHKSSHRDDEEDDVEVEEEEADDGSWRVVTKAWHMITVLKAYQEASLASAPTNSSGSGSGKQRRLPLKAVVFSQFRSYLNGLAAALRSQGFRVGCFFDKTRVQDLTAFRDLSLPPAVGLQVLLIGKEGSHGLDLSMATHLFVMDQIFDRNLEDQVISRAYRMGARAPCRVEFLSMAGTVEETMEALAATGGGGSGGDDAGLGHTVAAAAAAGAAVMGGDDEASVSSGVSAAGASMSSLLAHGRGSWEGGKGKAAGNGGGAAAAAAAAATAPAQGAAGKSRRRRASLSGRKRQGPGAGKSGTGAAGGGAEDMTKMHRLLEALDLVAVPGAMRRAARRASSSGSDAVGHGGSRVEAAAAAAVPSSCTEQPPPARRVRFAAADDQDEDGGGGK